VQPDCSFFAEVSSWGLASQKLGQLNVGDNIRSRAEQVMSTMYSVLSAERKDCDFEVMHSGDTCILYATDLFGAGINIPRILPVIQWKVRDLSGHGLDTLLQRFRHEARDANP
jgi:hypothetical protein